MLKSFLRRRTRQQAIRIYSPVVIYLRSIARESIVDKERISPNQMKIRPKKHFSHSVDRSDAKRTWLGVSAHIGSVLVVMLSLTGSVCRGQAGIATTIVAGAVANKVGTALIQEARASGANLIAQ